MVIDTAKQAAVLSADGTTIDTPGSRVIKLQYKCKDVTDSMVLNVATNDFLSRGGDSYIPFATAPKVLTYGPLLSLATSDHMTTISGVATGTVCLQPPVVVS